jgi:NAD(P)-dependent dehydrogenase (short-subunit alcohol dehydrogenase family)
MTIRFDNRVAIVTGAGNGLGRAHALLLASRGAKVVVNDPGGAVDGKGGGQAAADKVVDEIKAAGGQAVANYDSVADAASAANIVKTAVDSFGTVDIVVDNAGVLRDKTFHNMTTEDFDFVVKVHFLGTAYVTHAAWPILRAKAYGRVVVTSSNSGMRSASKARSTMFSSTRSPRWRARA